VDSFLIEKMKKIEVLEKCLLPLASKNVIVNFVFGFNFLVHYYKLGTIDYGLFQVQGNDMELFMMWARSHH
jgi:hypothetical protein